jgi:hypothetical protein
MRSFGILCLVGAAILWLLEEIAPRHSLLSALKDIADAVPMGLSLPAALAILGAIVLLPTMIRFERAPRRVSPPASTRPRTQAATTSAQSKDESTESPVPTSEWKEVLFEAIDKMDLEQGVSLHIDRSQGTPFTLVLERCTPGRARRAMNELGLFLTRVPRPPRVTILFDKCERGNVPWQHMVTGGLAPHIGRQTARMVAHTDRVDLIFTDADPCYSPTEEE